MRRFQLSPPVILIFTAILVLGGLLSIMTYRNLRWEQEQMHASLRREASLLARTVEAGARTGMMEMMWGESELQSLIEETARQPDVAFIALLDDSHQIVAHSDRRQIGTTFSQELPPMQEGIQAGVVESTDQSRLFELVHRFQPLQNMSTGMIQMHRMMGHRLPDASPRFLVVTLSTEAYDQRRAEAVRRALLVGGVLLLVGSAGLYLMLLLQRHALTQRAFHQLRDYTQTLIQSMPSGLLSLDGEGRIVTVNPAAERILQRPLAEIRGIPYREVWDCMLLEELLSGQRSELEQEVECVLSDGRRVPLGLSATRLQGEEDAGGVVCLFRDLTELKRLEAQVRRADRLAAVGQLAASIAHEIRNPLNTLKGFAQYLHAKMPPEDARTRYTQLMVRESERLNRIITELLDFARALELQSVEIDINIVLQDTLTLMERDAQSQGVIFTLQFADKLSSISADPERLKQVFLNLVLNALQVMPDGGEIRVATRALERQVEVEIADTGPGIAVEDLPHIFDPFFSRRKGGTGLGLAMVHRIVDAHEAEIEVESAQGEGTCFRLRFH